RQSIELCGGAADSAVDAAGVSVAVGEKPLQGRFESGRLFEQLVRRTNGRIEDRIERQRANVIGKEVRVSLAEEGVVGETEIGDLVVSNRNPDQVHVPRGAHRVDKPEAFAAVPLAREGKRLFPVDQLLSWSPLGVWRGRHEVVQRTRAVAVHRRALPHTARSKPKRTKRE